MLSDSIVPSPFSGEDRKDPPRPSAKGMAPRAMMVSGDGRVERGEAMVEVIAEYAASDRTLEENLRHVLAHQPPPGPGAGAGAGATTTTRSQRWSR